MSNREQAGTASVVIRSKPSAARPVLGGGWSIDLACLVVCLTAGWGAGPGWTQEFALRQGLAISDEQFDKWVFQHFGSASGARQSLLLELGLKVDELDRVCRLSDDQRRRLTLAGRGDMQRFFDRFEQVKRSFRDTRQDRQDVQTVLQQIAPLQSVLQSGLFDQHSIVFKSLRGVLTEQQFAAYRRIQRERRDFGHQVAVELAVSVLEQGVPLRSAQREALIAKWLDETKPPKRSGQHDHFSILYQVSRLPANGLQALLDETQWRVVHHQLERAGGMEEWLRQRDGLPMEEEFDD